MFKMFKMIAIKNFIIMLMFSASCFAGTYNLTDWAKQYMKDCSVILDKKYYANCYSYYYKSPLVVAYSLSSEDLKKPKILKRPLFYEDYQIPKSYRTQWADYTRTGLDRGHIASNSSFNYDKFAQEATFAMSNIAPQYPETNRKMWLKAENLERFLAKKFKYVEVVNLVIYEQDAKTMRAGIKIPSYFFKLIKTPNKVFCYGIPNLKHFDDTNLNHYDCDYDEDPMSK